MAYHSALLMEMAFHAVDGEPDNWDGPEFLKMRHKVRQVYVPGLVSGLKDELSRVPQQLVYSGLEGILVPELLLNEVRQQVGPLRMSGLKVKIVKAPLADRALQIIEYFVKRAETELQPQYHGEARSAIAAVSPKYAANVQEAARALGISLTQETT